MKIVMETQISIMPSHRAFIVALTSFLLMSSVAIAADNVPSSMPSSTVAAGGVNAATAAAPSMAMAPASTNPTLGALAASASSSAPTSAPPSITLPPAVPNETAGVGASLDTAADSENSDKKTNKNLKNLESKVTDNAKDVVKRLGASTGDLTLEDLNAAKVTVAKIDALIDIEKHLADLDKIKEERAKISGSSTSFSPIPQIPATAFQPPSLPISPMPQRQFSDESSPMMAPPVSSMEVARILGADGHYSAVLTLFGGQTKVVHVGDKLSDGSVVTDISPKGVDIKGPSKSQLLLVKGVDKVYGRSL